MRIAHLLLHIFHFYTAAVRFQFSRSPRLYYSYTATVRFGILHNGIILCLNYSNFSVMVIQSQCRKEVKSQLTLLADVGLGHAGGKIVTNRVVAQIPTRVVNTLSQPPSL